MTMGRIRMAVLVGCNYPNTRNELRGCINDVVAIRQTLLTRFGFDAAHINLLTDAPSSTIKPTGANVKAALNRMVDSALPGDVLLFHYSGHGTVIPSGHFKQSEAIVPCDFNLITDVDFRHLVGRLVEGASFTIISDSCHSGGLIDKEKEQIGPSTISPTAPNISHGRSKMIPFPSVLEHLTTLSGLSSPHIGDHLSHLFGPDASLKFRTSDHSLTSKTDGGILLSGCQANETSADMGESGGGKAYGAFSDAIERVLKSHAGALSNRELVARARALLRTEGFRQHPCLYCSDNNVDASFLCQPSEKDQQ